MRKMKDSGVPWIGEIPEEWCIEPLKKRYSFDKGLPITKADLIETGLPVLSYGQIHSKENSPLHIKENLIRYVGDEYVSFSSSKANKGDIIFADTSEDTEGIGNHSYVDLTDGIFAGYHTILARKKMDEDGRYTSLLLETDAWRSQLRKLSSGIKVYSVTRRMLNSVTIAVPPVDEQQRIANYLDDKCGNIDAIIAKQEQIIEHLRAFGLSLIVETCTKGIRSKRNEYKDSGIDWIGDIPDSWDVASINRIATVVRGASPRPAGDPRFFNGSYMPWITVGEVTNALGKYVESTETFLTKEGTEQSRIVEAGTLLLSNSGATLGVPKITKITGCINDGSVAFYNLKVDKNYLLYVFEGRTLELRKQMQGYGQPNLNTTIIKGLFIPLPPMQEQKDIADYLDCMTEKIDREISSRQSLITKLTEYKKSLIYEVVTGKKEV